MWRRSLLIGKVLSRQLHIVRHGDVVIDPTARSVVWELSVSADDAIGDLLKRIDPSPSTHNYKPREESPANRLVTGPSPRPTDRHARWIGEHHRSQSGFLSAAAFRATLNEFFANPKKQVFGDESAEMSLQRFETAIRNLMDETRNDELIVSHGRVISLFLASRLITNPMEIWASLTLPDYRAMEWPSD